MPLQIRPPNSELILEPEVLSQASFSPFGTVIENPAPSLIPSSKLGLLPQNAVQVNQGSALKYLDVTDMKDHYGSASSKQPGKAVMNMFVCAPRTLLSSSNSNVDGNFGVEILERHPYTTQTFIPLGMSASDAKETRYLVIVAPTLSPSPADDGLPTPPATSTTGPLPGSGLPDLSRIRAFMATGSQAVTYGAGTWHAPMVVVGKMPIDFVVVQFANGVGIEDCQEVEWTTGGCIQVAVPKAAPVQSRGLWKL
jgi:ureidoglycolate lyase